MKYTDEDTCALQEFLLDIHCLDELQPWTSRFNLFDVLKISRAEIRHSNMLAWLLDPNENHGMGDVFLKGILQRLAENDGIGRYDIFKILLMDCYDYSVYREWRNIDLLLVSNIEKMLIAIENKIDSHEHNNQLERYRNILRESYPDYSQIYIFLTIDGEAPSDAENWDTLTYRDILDVLEQTCGQMSLLPDVKLMVDNYMEVVRRDIVEDRELIEVCNRIYNKHKKALDLIFENRIDGRSQVVNAVRNTLDELDKEGKIIYDASTPDTWIGFHTVAMDKILPPLADEKGSWGNDRIYSYWVAPKEESFQIGFELGGWNVPEQIMEFMQKMISLEKPNDNRRNFRYKRIRTKKYVLDASENTEDAVDKALRSAVNDFLAWEKDICQKLKGKRR